MADDRGRVVEQPERPVNIRQMRAARRPAPGALVGEVVDDGIRDPDLPVARPGKRASALLLDNPDKPEESAKAVCLRALRAYGNVRLAVEAAKISRATFRKWMKQKTFAQEAADALDDFVDTIELSAIQRAKAGSDRMIIFLLSANRPDKYGQRLTLTHDMTPQERQAIIAMAKADGLDPDEIIPAMDEGLKRLVSGGG